MIRMRNRWRLAIGPAVLALGACGGDGPAAPTGPDAYTELEGTWFGATAAHELTLAFSPDVFGTCLYGSCTGTEVWRVTGSYRDRATGAAFTIDVPIGSTRKSGRTVTTSLFTRHDSPTHPTAYAFEGTLVTRTRIDGRLEISTRDAATISVLLTLEPVFALAAGAVVLGERLDARGWLGAVVILAAIQLVLHREGDSPATDAEAITPY